MRGNGKALLLVCAVGLRHRFTLGGWDSGVYVRKGLRRERAWSAGQYKCQRAEQVDVDVLEGGVGRLEEGEVCGEFSYVHCMDEGIEEPRAKQDEEA